MMKRLFCLGSLVLVLFLVVGCGTKNEVKNIEDSLPDIMNKLYEGISEDEMPMMVENIELTEENFKYYAFADVKYKEAIASESMTGSTAHSVVLIRLEKDSDAEGVASKIKENADPRKWICVEAENVFVETKGDLVVLIMANELAPKIKTNFLNLK